jgi:hypothetical protein
MSLTISLTPQQVEERLELLHIPVRFSLEEKQRYSTTPVIASPYPLFGFPTPTDNLALTLFKIKEAVGSDPTHPPSIFDHPWYANEPFMEVPCPPGWHFLCLDVIPESVGQPLNYSSRLPAGLALPLAVEVAMMIFMHFAGTGEHLLLRKHTWCSDSAGVGGHATAGAFGRNGLFLSVHPEGFASRGLGICGTVRVGLNI